MDVTSIIIENSDSDINAISDSDESCCNSKKCENKSKCNVGLEITSSMNKLLNRFCCLEEAEMLDPTLVLVLPLVLVTCINSNIIMFFNVHFRI